MGYVGSKWLPKKIPHQKKTPNNEKTDDLLLQYLILNCITAKNEILYSTRTKIYGIIRKRTKTAYTMFIMWHVIMWHAKIACVVRIIDSVRTIPTKIKP